MIIEELRYFLRTGGFPHVPYGIDRATLESSLGQTEWQHFTEEKDRYPSIYKFGKLEFYFENGDSNARLRGVIYQAIPRPTDAGKLQCDYHGLDGKITLAEVVDFLAHEKIHFEERAFEWDPDIRLLVTEGLVDIIFDQAETEATWHLHKAVRFVDLD